MNVLEFEVLRLRRKVPLRISRGLSNEAAIVWIRWREAGVTGWGECVPYDLGAGGGESLQEILAALEWAKSWSTAFSGWHRDKIENRMMARAGGRSATTGLIQAVIDWQGKVRGQPAWELFGFIAPKVPSTSVTIGIGTPEEARARVRKWRELHDFRAFKVKAGARDGIAADQRSIDAVLDEVGSGCRVSVDANGGWSRTQAIEMMQWLHGRGIDHLEQPLPVGCEAELSGLRNASPLPIFADESCRSVSDLPALSGRVDGVNVKLPKCGGFDAGLRLIAAARREGMQILVGCYGSSALGNSAAACVGALADHVDLDSHLNLESDPFVGAQLVDGRLMPAAGPGFGVTLAL